MFARMSFNTADIIATGGGIIESEEAFNFLKNQKNIISLG